MARLGGKIGDAQRGLSLVEVMLALIVVGLLLGASIVPLGQLTVADAYQRENEKMEAARDAILGYAVSHRTKAREVVVEAAADNHRRFDIPAGRPYLPCPDLDGDGHEDRGGYDVLGALAPADGALTVSATDNPLATVGNCAASRGVLPWKTLGLPPADLWGNRYTYEVDDVFSNAVVGFGGDIVADAFDARKTVTLDADGKIFYDRRDANKTIEISRDGAPFSYTNYPRPIVVCDGSAEVCDANMAMASTLDLPLEAGAIAADGFNAPRKQYQQYDVTEGVPYVIVSHGKNGHGAVNHLFNVRDSALAGAVGIGVVCNYPISGSRLAPSAAAVALEDYQRREAVNFPFVAESAPNAARFCPPISGLNSGHFVHQPRVNEFFASSGGGDDYDDIVVWMTRRQLTQEMAKAGVFPVERFPVLRGY